MSARRANARATWTRRSAPAAWASCACWNCSRSTAIETAGLAEELLDYSERLVRAELRTCRRRIRAEDWLDDDGVTEPVQIAVELRMDPGRLDRGDFTGSAAAGAGERECGPCDYVSACFICCGACCQRAPATAGILRPLTLTTRRQHCGRAAAGRGRRRQCRNVAAHRGRAPSSACPGVPPRVPAASAGTMSNLDDRRIGSTQQGAFRILRDSGGGMGARPQLDGIPGCRRI